jgi:hypothetical protein
MDGPAACQQRIAFQPTKSERSTRSRRIRNAKPKLMRESLAANLYDLVRAEQFVPFSILFASGQRCEIKTREHIGLGPVSRSDVEGLKAVIVWDDAGQWRSVYMPAILKIERS